MSLLCAVAWMMAARAAVPSLDAWMPAGMSIEDRFVPFDEERHELTRAYLREHTGGSHVDTAMVPRLIVLHWTAGATAQAAWQAFAPTRLPGRPMLQAAGAVNVSAHFVVDRDGSIWRVVPENVVARHVIGLNHVAVGIENVGDGDQWPLTDAQIVANAALVRALVSAHPTITHLIGHHQYRQMEGHPYFVEEDPQYRTAKIDPGDAFVEAVRGRVSDLALKEAGEL